MKGYSLRDIKDVITHQCTARRTCVNLRYMQVNRKPQTRFDNFRRNVRQQYRLCILDLLTVQQRRDM